MSQVKKLLIKLVNEIPKSRVTNFGALATVLSTQTGSPISAQMVGWMLSGMPQEEWNMLPWWRVVAKDGYISSLKLGFKGNIQKDLLLKEKIEIDSENKVNMTKYLFLDFI